MCVCLMLLAFSVRVSASSCFYFIVIVIVVAPDGDVDGDVDVGDVISGDYWLVVDAACGFSVVCAVCHVLRSKYIIDAKYSQRAVANNHDHLVRHGSV